MVIKVGDKWCKATTTWKFWWNFLAKSLFFSRYPSFSPFECPDAYKCYTFSESYGSRETREIKISTSKFDLEAQGILSPLWTQTGPWSDTASYLNKVGRLHTCINLRVCIIASPLNSLCVLVCVHTWTSVELLRLVCFCMQVCTCKSVSLRALHYSGLNSSISQKWRENQ